MKLSSALATLAMIASLAGCFNASSYTPIIRDVRTALPPAPAGSITTGTTRIFVGGYFLFPDTTVFLDGRPQHTTYLPSSGLQVDLAAEATNVVGFHELTARTGSSLLSEPQRFVVLDAPLTVAGIAPRQIALNSTATIIVITGTGFNPSSQVFWNGNALATSFVSSTSLSAVVPAPQLAVAGDATVEVREKSCRSDLTYCNDSTASNLCTVGTEGGVVVAQAEVSSVAWDATHGLLFAVIHQLSAGFSRLATIDPLTGAASAGVSVGDYAALAVSAGDRFIYVAALGATAKRYALPGLTDELDLSVGGQRVSAAPDAPETAAFSGAGLQVVDGTTVRPHSAGAFLLLESLVWGFDASRIYGISGSAAGVQVYSVDPTGVTARAPFGSSRFPIRNDLAFDRVRRRLYANDGETFDEQGLALSPFPIAANDQCMLALDTGAGKAFFACAQYGVGLTIRSFDLDTRQQISSVELLQGDRSTVLAASRFGGDGLAVAAGARLYLYRGQFVH